MCPPDKEERLINQSKGLICGALRNRRWIKVRVLAQFAGLAQSLTLAIRRGRMYLRSLYDCISTKRTWDSDVRLSKQAIRDLRWWTQLRRENLSRAIFREATTATLFSDSSGYAWGGVLNGTVISHGLWTSAQRERHHITELELLAVLENVKAHLPRLRRRKILVLEDNQAVCYVFRNSSSRSPVLMALLRETWAICELNDIELSVQYVSTHDNLSDAPSRMRHSDHWRLLPDVLAYVEKKFGFKHTVDRFATAATTLLPRFNSPFPDPEHRSEAVDGLSTDWHCEHNWWHPPVHLLNSVATRLQREPAVHGTVVAPYWPTEAWFSALRGVAASAVVVPQGNSLV